MTTNLYALHKGVNQPIEFRGLKAQYIGYLATGCVALLMIFALLYMGKVNPYMSMTLVLGAGGAWVSMVYRLSNRYGAHGIMKMMAHRKLPRAVHTRTLDARLPIQAIEQDCLVSKQGDITVAFLVTLPEIFTLSEEEYDTLHHAWVKAIKALPAHSVLHKQDWFREAAFRPKAGEEKSFLSQSSDSFFLDRPFLDHQCYLFITKQPEDRRVSTSAVSNLLHPGIVPAQTLDPKKCQAFLDTVGQFCQILRDSGWIGLERLREKDLVSTRHQVGLLEKYCFLQDHPTRRMSRDLAFVPDLRIGNRHGQLYTLADAASLPAFCSPSLPYDKYTTDQSKCVLSGGASLGQLLPVNHLYNQYIFIGDAQKTTREMEQRRRRLHSLSAYSRANAMARDQVDAFLTEMSTHQRLPVRAHFNLLVWAEDKEDFKEIRSKVATALSRLDMPLKEETLGAPQIFWAGIPGNAADFPVNDTFDTFSHQAVCFLNMETQYRSSVSPVGIRLGDRLTGVPVHVDISDEPVQKAICANRNKFILGPSGSGKSFFTNHMVRTYYEQGTHIVLVDVGHSYQGLCTLLGGYYFTYSEQQPLCFNPFYLEDGGFPDSEKKESIKTLLLALWKKDDETFLRSEYVALSNALQAYYEALQMNTGIFPGFDSFYVFLRDDFAGRLRQERVKDKDFDIDNFLYVLRPYFEGGEFDYLLNARENLDLLHKRFIVFELDNIKDHPILFPVVTIIIMEVFISKMRKLKGVRKMILIEEAWKAIAREGMAEYIQYLFKTVRKFYGEAVVVTQEVEDIISSPVVKQAIINNSDCKILLDQSKYQNKFGPIQELLGLTDKEKAQVLSLNKANESGKKYKEVFISLGGKVSRVYRTEVSPEEYLTYTTEETEKMQVMAYARQYGDMKKGIRALLSMRQLIVGGLCALCGLLAPTHRASAQIPLAGIIQSILKKVIVAADLQVQRLQNQTLGQQNDQKEVENVLSETELGDIASWVKQEEDLYTGYYHELWLAKEVLTSYQRVKDIIGRQAQIVTEYQQAYDLFRKDPHFTPSELQYMAGVYGGILDASVRNLDQLTLLVDSFSTQMSDGQRLNLIDATGERVNQNEADLRRFNQNNVLVSLQRSRDQNDLDGIKQLYGLP